MTLIKMLLRQSLDTLKIYWTLVRIVVPVAIATELMAQLGVIEALSPLLAPVMSLYGLPPDLALAWLTGMLIGIWGAVPIVMALGPGAAMSVADMTVFAALLLFAHALPIEQKIIQKTGAGLLVTTLVRVAGGMIYAALLHQLFAVTGWLSAPLNLAWMPARAASGWIGFIESLSTTLISMLVILLGVAWALELLKRSGLLEQLMRALDPLLGLAGIHGEARYFTTIGLFLGISYGGGLLIREARAGASTPRQILVSCVFMGFAHSIIEDTLIVMALGADVVAILVGRLVFAVAATALVAWVILRLPDETFFAWMFCGMLRAERTSPHERRAGEIEAEQQQADEEPAAKRLLIEPQPHRLSDPHADHSSDERRDGRRRERNVQHAGADQVD
jgi:spore maturation protein SpmB